MLSLCGIKPLHQTTCALPLHVWLRPHVLQVLISAMGIERPPNNRRKLVPSKASEDMLVIGHAMSLHGSGCVLKLRARAHSQLNERRQATERARGQAGYGI